MEKLKKFLIEDVFKNPIVKKYSLWIYLLGSITILVQLGFKGLWIVMPLSLAVCCWMFWASGSFQEMKEGGQRIRWMMDARKAEKLKKKEDDRK